MKLAWLFNLEKSIYFTDWKKAGADHRLPWLLVYYTGCVLVRPVMTSTQSGACVLRDSVAQVTVLLIIHICNEVLF